ncbi:MAG: hypothetical protein R3C53_27455 [Pirellulaceae bacterium]
MSSSPSREPLSGQIRQDARIIGSICLPEEDVLEFIDQFNHCYGPLRMHIDPPQIVAPLPNVLLPVGAGLRNPLRPPQQFMSDDLANPYGSLNTDE